MNFDYIKSASSCEPICAKTGQKGPTPIGVDSKPIDATCDQSNPTTLCAPGVFNPNTGPVINQPVTGYGDGTPGQQIDCSVGVITPDVSEIKIGEILGFTLSVKYSNGVNFGGGTGIPGASVVWSSSDDSIAIFDKPTLSVIGPSGYGYYLRGIAAGTVTVSVHYSHPTNKGFIGSTTNDNWFGACDMVLTAQVTVDAAVVDPCQRTLPSGLLDGATYLEINGQSGDPTGVYGFMEVGDLPYQFGATLHYEDGHISDVSNLVTWSSSETNFGTIDCNGAFVAVAAGTSNVTATLPGLGGTPPTAIMQVVPPASLATFHGNTWTVTPIDTVIVLDRSASMNIRDEQGLSRVERAKEAAKIYLNNSATEPGSQLALVSFAGVWLAPANPGGTPQTQADATTDLTLTTDRREILEAINEFKVLGPCALMEGEGTRCATGIGAGLLAAFNELSSDRTQQSHKRMAILITDGCNNLPFPDPLTIANEIKAAGFLLCVIALDAPTCATDLQAIASPGLFFPSPTVFDLSYQVAQVNHYVGYYEIGYSWWPPY